MKSTAKKLRMSAVYKFIAFNLLKKKCFDWKRFMAFSHILVTIHVEIAFKLSTALLV
jgi:hypothetical protein